MISQCTQKPFLILTSAQVHAKYLFSCLTQCLCYDPNVFVDHTIQAPNAKQHLQLVNFHISLIKNKTSSVLSFISLTISNFPYQTSRNTHTLHLPNLDSRRLQVKMQLENVWRWLDAVDEDHLDPLVQWGLAPLQGLSQDPPRRPESVFCGDKARYQPHEKPHHAEDASLVRSIPPAKILLRDGSIRTTRKLGNDASDVETRKHPQLLQPGLGTSSGTTVPFQQRRGAPSTRKLKFLGREGNIDSGDSKRLPTFTERSRVRGLSQALQPNPNTVDHVKEPVTIDCEGARVLGGYQHNGLKDLPSMSPKLHGNTNAEEKVLHRSNAIRRPSNLRAEPKARPKYW